MYSLHMRFYAFNFMLNPCIKISSLYYDRFILMMLNVSVQQGRPKGTSDAAAKVAIAVTICLVLGISLIIIAVVCFVRRAKERKRNEKGIICYAFYSGIRKLCAAV